MAPAGLTDEDRASLLHAALAQEAEYMNARNDYFCAFVKSADATVRQYICHPRCTHLPPFPPSHFIERAQATSAASVTLLRDGLCGLMLAKDGAFGLVPDGNSGRFYASSDHAELRVRNGAGGWDAYRAWANSNANDAFRVMTCVALLDRRGLTAAVAQYLEARRMFMGYVHDYNQVRVIYVSELVRGNTRASMSDTLPACLKRLEAVRQAVHHVRRRAYPHAKPVPATYIHDTRWMKT